MCISSEVICFDCSTVVGCTVEPLINLSTKDTIVVHFPIALSNLLREDNKSSPSVSLFGLLDAEQHIV